MAERAPEKSAFMPDYATAPGETLRETLREKGMNQRELALRAGLAPKTVNQIIKGKAPLTFETAIKLERSIGIPARFWNNLEASYREALARKKDMRRLEAKEEWLRERCIPVDELMSRGYISRPDAREDLLGSVLRFFGVGSVDAWDDFWLSPRCAFRMSTRFRARPGACAAWLRMGQLKAQEIECKPFDRGGFLGVLGGIRGNTRNLSHDNFSDIYGRMQGMCAGVGVAIVFIKELPGAPVSGAAMWMTSDKALIMLSLRYKRDDRFWFSLFHEAGHVLKSGKREMFVDSPNAGAGETEGAADSFAANFLIPEKYVARLHALRSRDDVKRFSRELGIAPGIVVGRLQRDGVIKYSELNDLRVRLSWEE